MRNFEPGKHTAKIADYGISKTSKGKPQAFIVFESEGKSITWYGGLDPKPAEEGKRAPLEFTIKTLLDCGLSTDVVENMAAGTQSNALPVGKEMELVIEDNVWEGQVQSRIKWVNIPGFVSGPPRVDHAEAGTLVNSGALRAELMRQKKGPATPKSPL